VKYALGAGGCAGGGGSGPGPRGWRRHQDAARRGRGVRGGVARSADAV